MTKAVKHREPNSGIRRRLAGTALALAIILVPGLVATKAAQAQTLTTLYTFTGDGEKGQDSAFPVAGVIRDQAGNLYGTTPYGGASGNGTVFKLSKSGKESVLYSFAGTGGDGATPKASVILDQAGNLYGTTSAGGASGNGTAFKLDKSGKETVLYSFAGTGGDGANPSARLVLDQAGNLYGTTFYGGAHNSGTVFKLDKSGKETVLYGFSGGADGANPYAGVILDAAGDLYGTTHFGGSGACTDNQNSVGCGTVFKLDKNGKETVLHSFTGGADGANPYAGVILDAAGDLYGTTEFGGSGACTDLLGGVGCGTVFKLDKSGKETVVYSFQGDWDGANPYAGLIGDQTGNLYGTTFSGGAYDSGVSGTLFKLDKSGRETVLYNFPKFKSIVSFNVGSLALDAKGNLYGTTAIESGSDTGTVFKLGP